MTFKKLIFKERNHRNHTFTLWVTALVLTDYCFPHWRSHATDTGQAPPGTAGSRPNVNPNPAHDRGARCQLLRRSYARCYALSDSWALCRMWQPERTDPGTGGNISPVQGEYHHNAQNTVLFKWRYLTMFHKWGGPLNEVYYEVGMLGIYTCGDSIKRGQDCCALPGGGGLQRVG